MITFGIATWIVFNALIKQRVSHCSCFEIPRLQGVRFLAPPYVIVFSVLSYFLEWGLSREEKIIAGHEQLRTTVPHWLPQMITAKRR